jgi:expansin (peptidoglycan-binding protein)
MICALQTTMYADGAHCGKKIQVTRTDTKESMTVTVADSCPSCEGEGYVDFSESAFLKLGTIDEGMVSRMSEDARAVLRRCVVGSTIYLGFLLIEKGGEAGSWGRRDDHTQQRARHDWKMKPRRKNGGEQ